MLNKNYWTKLSAEFNAYTEKSTWRKPRSIQIEHTGFFNRHVGDRGLNHDESGLLDFGTKLIEARRVHFAYRSYGKGAAKRRYVTLYIDSTVHSENAGTYVEYVKEGKTFSFHIFDRNDTIDVIPWQLKDILSKDESCNLFQCYKQDEFKKKLENAGCKLLVFFRFNQLVSVNLPHHSSNGSIGLGYVKPNRYGIELGYRSEGTYNSLPNVVKIKRVSEIQGVKLYELGIESRGYYSHDFKCSIPRSQAKQAKRFFAKRFSSK